jgi:hypothetical protein
VFAQNFESLEVLLSYLLEDLFGGYAYLVALFMAACVALDVLGLAYSYRSQMPPTPCGETAQKQAANQLS